MLLDNILQAIGKTPIVKLHRIGADLPCELYGKCEFLNPGGSVKDRIGYHMVEQAEKEGTIKPGDTLIEPTSGNTGIGIALAGAVKGYKVVITLREEMSNEKLNEEIPNSHILDQYANPDNPGIHYQHTAQEILDDMGSDLAMVVMGVGTGGTITGVAKKLKEEIPNIQIIGVDPIGSILGGGTEVKPYLVEGIGYDFFPDVLDNTLVDEYIKINDKDSFLMARRLISEEGLLIGGSSGSAVWAALQVAKKLKKGQKCLVILPDAIRNYLTKFADNHWMKERGFV